MTGRTAFTLGVVVLVISSVLSIYLGRRTREAHEALEQHCKAAGGELLRDSRANTVCAKRIEPVPKENQ